MPILQNAQLCCGVCGVKTKEERSLEQFEEQKVIEAQLRIRQKEIQDEEAKMKRKQSRCSSSRTVTPTKEVEYRDICSTSFSVPSYQCADQGTECCSSEPSCSNQTSMRPFHSRHNRDDNVDMNLEDMMVMEAIWRSIQQEQGHLVNPVCGSYFPVIEPQTRERQAFLPAAPMEMPHPGGYSCAVAALAEHQPPSMDFSYMAGSSTFPVYDMIRRPCNMSGGSMCAVENSSLDLEWDCTKLQQRISTRGGGVLNRPLVGGRGGRNKLCRIGYHGRRRDHAAITFCGELCHGSEPLPSR